MSLEEQKKERHVADNRPSAWDSAKDRCTVSVRIAEEDGDEDLMYLVEIQLWTSGEWEGSVPDRWYISWTHYKEIIRDNFWPFINKHCPEPEAVYAAVDHLKIADDIWDALFTGEGDAGVKVP